MSIPQRLVLSSISTGLQTFDKPFLLNNDAFPTLENGLCWRRQLIKKPGSFQLGRLSRLLANTGASPFVFNILPIPIKHGVSEFVIGSVILTDADITGAAIANLTSSDPSYSGTLDRTLGTLTINHPVIAPTPVQFVPSLPVMGIEEFESAQLASDPVDFPVNVYFDTVYSYRFNGLIFEDNSFYKTTGFLVTWSGADYQQFDSTNYFRALFVTNNNPGLHFATVTAAANQGPALAITLTLNQSDLRNGDVVFFYQGAGTTWTLNGKTAVVTNDAARPIYVFTFTAVQTVNTYTASSAKAFYLTNTLPGGGDGIRWYDGQGAPPPGGLLGFSNFAPPLASPTAPVITYLMGCRIIIPFGNRLLAIGTFEGTSLSTAVYFGNRIRYCQVTATPFYANAPPNVGVEPLAWISDIQGFGGFIDLDTNERIISAAVTQGALILGLESEQRNLTNTGVETDPFIIQVINPEYGTAGTHAIVPMDKGIMTVGEYGLIETSSYDAKRFDLPIVEQVFQINPQSNGFERICGGRDFVNEVLYFSYPSIFDPMDVSESIFPDTSLVYNYREKSFAIWFESPTTYGLVKEQQKTWSALTTFTWATWNLPWNSPATVSQYPFVAFGTPQGFVMLKWYYDTTNDPSIMIQAISTVNPDGTYSVTSPNHNLFAGAFVGFLSPTSANPEFIGLVEHLGDFNSANPASIFTVSFLPTATPGSIVSGTWEVSIVDKPFIQTKQFPFAWSGSRKIRIGAQKYFLDKTEFGEFTVDILGSQSPVPLNNSTVSNPMPSLISNAIVRTRPDDSLGLNDAANQQEQIWHRLASSAIGDTVQLQFSFSQDQMFDVPIATSPWVLHVCILDLYPSRTLA